MGDGGRGKGALRGRRAAPGEGLRAPQPERAAPRGWEEGEWALGRRGKEPAAGGIPEPASLPPSLSPPVSPSSSPPPSVPGGQAGSSPSPGALSRAAAAPGFGRGFHSWTAMGVRGSFWRHWDLPSSLQKRPPSPSRKNGLP